MTNPNLPPEFDGLLKLLAAQSEPVRAMWKYALVLMMIDDEKARVVESHQVGDTLHLIVQTVAGERFEIERPAMSEETEHMLLEQIREIVIEESIRDEHNRRISMSFPSGPYVQAACFCETIIEDRQGVLSLIRLIDTATALARGENPPLQMPPLQHRLTLVIMLKSGEARGRETLTVVPELPTGELKTPYKVSVHFEGGEKGHNVVLNLDFTFEYEGIYWFKVYLDDAPLTAVPFRVKYDSITTSVT